MVESSLSFVSQAETVASASVWCSTSVRPGTRGEARPANFCNQALPPRMCGKVRRSWVLWNQATDTAYRPLSAQEKADCTVVKGVCVCAYCAGVLVVVGLQLFLSRETSSFFEKPCLLCYTNPIKEPLLNGLANGSCGLWSTVICKSVEEESAELLSLCAIK